MILQIFITMIHRELEQIITPENTGAFLAG